MKPKQKLKQAGFSTLEMMIAMALMILVLSGASSVIFKNQSGAGAAIIKSQSVSNDSQTGLEALLIARKKLDEVYETARRDYESATDVSETLVSGISYETEIKSHNATQCGKQISSAVFWTREGGRRAEVKLETYVSNLSLMFDLGGNCQTAVPKKDWRKPLVLTAVERGQLDGSRTVGLNMIGNQIYAIGSASEENKPDLLTFGSAGLDIGNPGGLSISGKTDCQTKAYNAIVVANHSGSGRTYAYVANNAAQNQLQVIDVSDPSHPVAITLANRTLPGVGNSYPQGWSIYFYKDRIYIATRETAGPEFHVYDVSDPANPVHLGSKEINHNVNAIVVRDQVVAGEKKTLAYLALSATNPAAPEMEVLDVANPAAIPAPVGKFFAAGTQEAKSLYLLEKKIYLGRAKGNNGAPNFYVIDVGDPAAPSSCLTCNSSNVTHYANNEDIRGMVVSGKYAFLATSFGLRILNVSDQANIEVPAAAPHGAFQTSKGLSAVAFDNDLIYAATPDVPGAGDSAFYVFYPSED
ncbi:MAG TPA: hypothetical protein P5080_05905 [Candidatus Paceibacterota bacterium]|nr:hypothetical protein [Candidatus Pacearchaeota archaeon]HRZ51457.1 hypothetical protein [Candidatus Paceibacterota bacterium]HSA37201.1 hypothetical protein [Candidatus Paceibacterota bacterium]